MKLENGSGEATTFISLKVLDTASHPTQLTVNKVTQDSVSLSWDAPEIEGGSEVFNYKVEKREATQRTWKTVVQECSKLSYKVMYYCISLYNY